MGRQTVMTHFSWTLFMAAVVATSITISPIVRAADDDDGDRGPNRYVVTNLTTDVSGTAPNADTVLQNAWGVAFTPRASPSWIAYHGTGCSTLFAGGRRPRTC